MLASNVVRGASMVYSISDFPLASMLDEYRACLSKPQFQHFQNVLAGLMLNGRGEKNIQDIATNALDGRSQSSVNRFLHGSWPEAVERHRLDEHARGRQGGVLVLDDTLIEKSGREMEGTGYLYDHSQHRNVWCHCFVTSMYSDGDERVPLHLEPYVKEEACASSSRAFKTKNELAVELVDRALELVHPEVVVFDSWYGSQEVMRHLESRGLKFVTESKGNRLIEDGGKKQVRDYLACHQDEFRRIKRSRTEYRWYHEKVSEIKGGLVVKFVFLKKELADKALVLMTNALDASVQDVVKDYKRRWDIEVYYRDCKQSLGMSDYQVRSIDVGVTHLLLVNMAYTLLKSVACSRLFQHIFHGANAIGTMCEALKRFAIMGLRRTWRDQG
jgi:SRSO17 transposase